MSGLDAQEIIKLVKEEKYEDALGVGVGAKQEEIDEQHLLLVSEYSDNYDVQDSLNNAKSHLMEEQSNDSNKGQRLFRIGKSDEAILYLKRAVKSRGTIEDQASLGVMLASMGFYREAIPYLKVTLEYQANDKLVNYWYGMSLLNLYFVEEAIPFLLDGGVKNVPISVPTLKTDPMGYAYLQHARGFAYAKYARVEDVPQNWKIAIQGYNESLKVYNRSLPEQYSLALNNIGYAYTRLAELEDPAANSKKAICALKEALSIRTADSDEADNAWTMRNLGYAYLTLAKGESKILNCETSISIFNDVLKVYTLSAYPDEYAKTNNYLGVAYLRMYEAEPLVEYIKQAIGFFKEALKVRTATHIPTEFAESEVNLAKAYATLARVCDKTANKEKALDAYNQALKIYTKQDFLSLNQKVENALRELEVI
ncbi:MAG: tetratricopeptide repeat protein [Candidatus Bathyarchaeota archaeon]|nr:tetratricopeptide repeat protein [Candidatus Bathyarchaeota archaeon]